MAQIQKPSRGTSVPDYVGSKALWDQLIDMLTEYQNGTGRFEPANLGLRCNPMMKNNTGFVIPPGAVQQLDPLNQIPAGVDFGTLKLLRNGPVWGLKDPVWHTEIDNVIVTLRAITENSIHAVPSARFIVTKVTQTKPTDGWAMIDAGVPTELRSADAGIYRILDFFDLRAGDLQHYAVLDIEQSQPVWRAELLESGQAQPATTRAKLLRLDGDEFVVGTEIQVTDSGGNIQGEPSGSKIFVEHIGNEFHAIHGGSGGTVIAKTRPDGIPARDGSNVVGQADVDLYEFNLAGNDIVPTGESEICLNVFGQDIGGDAFIMCVRIGPNLYVVAEDCPPGEPPVTWAGGE